MSELKKIIVDDGSVASKLLQHEYKDAQVIKVSGDNIFEWFTKVDPKNQDQRIYLPFTTDDLTENKGQRREAVTDVEKLGFKNQVVLPYDGVDNGTINVRAKRAGIIEQNEKLSGERHKLSYPEHNGVVKDEDANKKQVRTGYFRTKQE